MVIQINVLNGKGKDKSLHKLPSLIDSLTVLKIIITLHTHTHTQYNTL